MNTNLQKTAYIKDLQVSGYIKEHFSFSTFVLARQDAILIENSQGTLDYSYEKTQFNGHHTLAIFVKYLKTNEDFTIKYDSFEAFLNTLRNIVYNATPNDREVEVLEMLRNMESDKTVLARIDEAAFDASIDQIEFE